MKRDIPFEELYPNCPQEFVDYMKYVRTIEFEAKPDYNQCRRFFQQVMDKNEWAMDYEYDWVIKKREAAAKAEHQEENKTGKENPEEKKHKNHKARGDSAEPPTLAGKKPLDKEQLEELKKQRKERLAAIMD